MGGGGGCEGPWAPPAGPAPGRRRWAGRAASVLEFCLIFCTVSGLGQSSLWSLTVHWILLSYACPDRTHGCGREAGRGLGASLGPLPGLPGGGVTRLLSCCCFSRKVPSVFVWRASWEEDGRRGWGPWRTEGWGDSGAWPWPALLACSGCCSDAPLRRRVTFTAIACRSRRPMTHQPAANAEKACGWPRPG